MLTYEVIKSACQFSDNEELADKLSIATDYETDFTEKEKLVLARYLDCANYVQDEIASQYAPLKMQETFKTDNFKLEKSQFCKKPIMILSVKDSHGQEVKYKDFPTYIMAFASKVKVTYGYKPEPLGYDSEFEVDLPSRVLAYGVAREYYLRQGITEDAEIWEGRFKDSLKVILRKKSGTKLPGRRWL